jgi:hypothetical protein
MILDRVLGLAQVFLLDSMGQQLNTKTLVHICASMKDLLQYWTMDLV